MKDTLLENEYEFHPFTNHTHVYTTLFLQSFNRFTKLYLYKKYVLSGDKKKLKTCQEKRTWIGGERCAFLTSNSIHSSTDFKTYQILL